MDPYQLGAVPQTGPHQLGAIPQTDPYQLGAIPQTGPHQLGSVPQGVPTNWEPYLTWIPTNWEPYLRRVPTNWEPYLRRIPTNWEPYLRQVCARSASRADDTGTSQGFDSTLTIGPIVGSDPIPTTPETCKADEEWQQRGDQFRCFCKDPYKVTALSQVVPDLTCGLSEMRATFHKCQFNDLNIYFNQSHVKNYVYYIFQDDPVTNTFKIRAPLELIQSGGLSYKTNDTHATYTANFIIVVDQLGAIITRNNTLNITLQCAYELDMIASLQKTLHPIIRPKKANTGDTGTGQEPDSEQSPADKI
ncbi:uromodulin-like [Lithobates pipiens]